MLEFIWNLVFIGLGIIALIGIVILLIVVLYGGVKIVKDIRGD